MHKIPVTVVTGFLGAGKTTLLRHLLKNNEGRRIAVIVNEFGEIGIDGELLRSCQVCDEPGAAAENENIIELANGCLCCTVQEEFFPVMQSLLRRRQDLDCILIETSGLALPKPLVQAFQWPEIKNAATVSAVVTVADCAAIAAGTFASDLDAIAAQREADEELDHETPLEELFEDQLNCADIVLLTKVDLCEQAVGERVQSWLKSQLAPRVKILPIEQGVVSSDLLFGFNAAVEDNLADRHSHHDHEEEHDHDDEMNSVEFVAPETPEAEQLVAGLRSLMAQSEIYRVKGFVNVAHKPMRLVLQGVGDRFELFYDRRWREQETRETRLVLIGRDLEASGIAKQLKS
ncbi:MAG: cobalamin biosynthesis protein CobW [Cyanobacteria bacterium P01_H01_bin.15]